MNDRELLERAARAAGIHIHSWNFIGYAIIAGPDGKPMGWNALLDDGDALRLGVEMCMFDESAQFQWNLAVAQGQTDDQFAATRRAITLTAAESI